MFVLPTYQGGGAEHIVMKVARRLGSLGHSVLMVGLLEPPGTKLGPSLSASGLGKRSVTRSMLPLLRLIQEQRPTTVVSTLKHVSMAVALVQLVSPVRFKHVIRVANTYSRELQDLSPSTRILWRTMLRLSHSLAHQTICVSEGVKSDLVKNLSVPAKRCTSIPNPVDIEEIDRLSQQPHELLARVPAQHKVVLSVGRLTAQKDFTTLIDAFAALSVRTEHTCTLIILGEGPERSKLESQCRRLGISDYVHLPGRVDNPYPIYHRADVFVLSSRFEGLPNVILEALAVGVPVVSTNCESGPREILQDTRLGRMVPVGDGESMANALVRAIDLPKDNFRRQYVAERFEVTKVVQMYESAIVNS